MGKIAQEIYDTMKDIDIVYERDLDVQMKYCEQMERDCLRNKQHLIDILSKHPNWDSENMRVHFDKNYERVVDVGEARYRLMSACGCVTRHLNFANKLYSDVKWCRLYYLAIHIDSNAKRYAVKSIEQELVDNLRSYSPYITPSEYHSIERLDFSDAHIHAGAKGTKQVMKLFRQYGFEDLPEDVKHNFLQEYSKFADAMNPLTITRHTVLSVNPVDFLRMSYGNSWNSCHDIRESGCYCAGCESYAYDKTSMILYTVDAEVESDKITFAPKINRQMNFFNGDALVSVRVYPQECDGDKGIYNECKTLVQEILSTALGRPNMWKETNWKSTTRGHQYADYVHFGPYKAYTLSDYTLRERLENNWCDSVKSVDEYGEIVGIEKSTIHIGSDDAICLCCGGYLDEDGIPVCSGCGGDGECCEHCGEPVASDEGVWVGDCLYCDYCRDEYLEYCDDCQEYFRPGNVRYYDRIARALCDGCADDSYYTTCDDCGELIRTDDSIYVEDMGDVCEDCAESNYYHCSCCGDWYATYDRGNDTRDDGWVCQSCLNDHYEYVRRGRD